MDLMRKIHNNHNHQVGRELYSIPPLLALGPKDNYDLPAFYNATLSSRGDSLLFSLCFQLSIVARNNLFSTSTVITVDT